MKYFFIALFTVLITGLISVYGKYQKPKAITESSGRLTPGKTSAWITIIAGLAMAVSSLAFFIYVLISGEDYTQHSWTLATFLVGAMISGFMLPSLFSIHDIIWDEEGVEGAKSTFGPTLGWKRHKIEWEDIIKRGETATQYWYLETHNKQRVYWSYLYPGYGEFDRVIVQKCKNLKTGEI